MTLRQKYSASHDNSFQSVIPLTFPFAFIFLLSTLPAARLLTCTNKVMWHMSQ